MNMKSIQYIINAVFLIFLGCNQAIEHGIENDQNSISQRVDLHGQAFEGTLGNCNYTVDQWNTLQREILWLRTTVESDLFEECIIDGVNNDEIVGCPNYDAIKYTDDNYADKIIDTIRNGHDVELNCFAESTTTTAFSNGVPEIIWTNTAHGIYWNMPSYAGILGHEIMHAYGFTHTDIPSGRICAPPYTPEGCVNESVERCVREVLEDAIALAPANNIEVCGNGGILLPTDNGDGAECKYAPFGSGNHNVPLKLSSIVGTGEQIQWHIFDHAWTAITTGSGTWNKSNEINETEGTMLQVTSQLLASGNEDLQITNSSTRIPAAGYIIQKEYNVVAYKPSIVCAAISSILL